MDGVSRELTRVAGISESQFKVHMSIYLSAGILYEVLQLVNVFERGTEPWWISAEVDRAWCDALRRNFPPQVEEQVCRWRCDAQLPDHPNHLTAMQRRMISNVLHLIHQPH